MLSTGASTGASSANRRSSMSFNVKLLSEVVSQVVVFLVGANPERVSATSLHQSQPSWRMRKRRSSPSYTHRRSSREAAQQRMPSFMPIAYLSATLLWRQAPTLHAEVSQQRMSGSCGGAETTLRPQKRCQVSPSGGQYQCHATPGRATDD